MRSFSISLHSAVVTEPGKTSLHPAGYPETMELKQTFKNKAKRSTRGYTEVTAAKPLQYEHRMKVNDFLYVLSGGEIKSKTFEIFPGTEVSFTIGKYPRSCLLLSMYYKGGKYLAIAGNVRVDIDGKVQTKAIGDQEKNIYVPLANLLHQGPFPISDVEADKKAALEVVWTVYKQQPPSVSHQERAESPAPLMVQESLSVVGRAMKEDVSTADLIVKCGTEIFRAHKVVLCSRLVCLDDNSVPPILIPLSKVSGLQSHDPGRHAGGRDGEDHCGGRGL